MNNDHASLTRTVVTAFRMGAIAIATLALAACGSPHAAAAPAAANIATPAAAAMRTAPAPAAAAETPAPPAAAETPAPQEAASPIALPFSTDAARQTPSARFSPAMAYDAAREEVVLFGGATLGTNGLVYFSDTWVWRGSSWTQLRPAHSPSPRAWAQMADDPIRRDLVLFGGQSETIPRLTDTWLWNGSDWTQVTPVFTPQGTIEEGMTFFRRMGTVLLYSGDFAGPNHLYSWDGTNWTDLQVPNGPPPSAFQGGLAADPERQVVVLLASDVNQSQLQHWEFDGTSWTHRDVPTPPTRSLLQTATDLRTETIVMFGGIGFNDTWTWDQGAWTQQHPRHSPPQRSSTGPMPGMAYDVERGDVVVFGGIDNGNVALNDTWTWNGRDWR